MISLLWIIGIILLIGWVLGLFVFQVGGLINILLVVAIVCLIIWLIRRV